MIRLREKYEKEIISRMQEKFQYKNINMVPKLEKVVVSIGLGEALQNPKALESAVKDLSQIVGQAPVVTKAKKSIAACIHDFRGISSKSFDGRGNYAFGLKEQTIFPEIEYDKVDKVRGMDINIVTTAKTDEEARYFIKLLGCPLKEN